VKGYAWYKDQLYAGADFLNLIKKLFESAHWENFISKLNGSFLISIKLQNKSFVVSDSLRSIPSYYYLVNNKIVFVTDNSELIKKRTPQISPKNFEEFKATGFTTSNKTIITNYFQIEANTILQFDDLGNFSSTKYSRNCSAKTNDTPYRELLKQSNEKLNNLAQRLISNLDGKTAVIPLSGGYDSRIIATLLKKLSYKKVICFTYGRQTSEEVKYSKTIAKKLGYKWIFVEYDKNLIDSFWSQFECFYTSIFDFVSIPHPQDFFAVQYLVKNKLVPKNSVFIPGHSGDLIGGSHLKKAIKGVQNYSINSIANYIFKNHFLYLSKIKHQSLHVNRIKQTLEKNSESINNKINLTDLWNIDNRQAKFIVNSVRVYEHFGFSWLLPLWDKEFAFFFYELNIKYKIKKNIYNNLLEKYFSEYDILINPKRTTIKALMLALFRKILPNHLKIILKKLNKQRIDINNFDYIIKKLEYKNSSKIYHVNAAMIYKVSKIIESEYANK
jgi:asparagine synthase (glutamine-hydrolysing)